MTERQKLYRAFRRLYFKPDEARFYTRKLMELKKCIDRKYIDNAENISFFPSTMPVN